MSAPTVQPIFARNILARTISSFYIRPQPFGIADEDQFDPRSLYQNNEQGIWLDPSDFSSMFQDSAGTTPVTALGQPVGLALDKRLGLALGAELVTNGDFDNADGWVLQSEISISGGSLNFNSTATRTATATGASCVSGRWYLIEFDFTYTSGTARFDAGGGTTTITGSTGHKKYIRQATGTNAFCFTCASAGAVYSVDNISVREIAGNHASQATAASRPTIQQDSNGMYYLNFDGTDDSMATPSINFTGTDKMTVVTGVRKNSDVNPGMIFELSSDIGANNGTIALHSPKFGSQTRFNLESKGTVIAAAIDTAAAAPVTKVITCSANIAGDSLTLRANGAVAQATSTDQGTGNYGNYPLYIGRRAATTLPFNGRLYGLIVRGAESNAGQIAATEQYMNSKTRAY